MTDNLYKNIRTYGRKVSDVHYRATGEGMLLVLECGHVLQRPKRATTPSHTYCPQCEWNDGPGGK